MPPEHDSDPPTQLSPPTPLTNPDQPPLWARLARWLADRSATALITTLVAAVITVAVLHEALPSTPPPPLADQWLSQRAAIAKEGWQVAQTREVDLRGDGEASMILVLSSTLPSCTGPTAVRSDELRVYDVEDGRLRQTFLFDPIQRGCSAMNFQFVHVSDLEQEHDAPIILGDFFGQPAHRLPKV